MSELSNRQLETLLTALGDLLGAAGASYAIVVVGGAALSLLGWIERTTTDVDVIALHEREGEGDALVSPEPLPPVLSDAIATIARDFSLPSDWMNTQVASEWAVGAPTYLTEGMTWRRFGALSVGLPGRQTLVALKLAAAVDRDLASVHYQDLIALKPSEAELQLAERWVLDHDAGEEFPKLLEKALSHVRNDLGRDR